VSVFLGAFLFQSSYFVLQEAGKKKQESRIKEASPGAKKRRNTVTTPKKRKSLAETSEFSDQAAPLPFEEDIPKKRTKTHGEMTGTVRSRYQ
jgi:hypothetical protein